ncbi:MAG: hypothetical protein KDD48_01095 [Bdellovibrionales bacterium]|nr:hypothetical protein [Bdellovibrionales bacterium]
MTKKYLIKKTLLNFFLSASVLVISSAFGQEADVPSSEDVNPLIETYGVPETQPTPVDSVANEVPPINVSPSENGETLEAPVSSPPVADTNIAQQVPVAEPTTLAPVASPDDDTLKGVKFDLGVTVYPVGFDKINLGSSSPAQGGKWFFGLKPGANFSTAFMTGGGRKVNLSTGYEFMYREYYNRTGNKRDFNHALSAGIDVQWSPLFSTSIPAAFEYFIKSGVDTEAETGIFIYVGPELGFQINDRVGLSLAYDVSYFEGATEFLSILDMNTGGSAVDPLGDVIVDDDSLDGNVFGFNPTVSPAPQDRWVLAWHRLVPGVSVKFGDTALSFKYAYALKNFSNDDSQEWKGHYFVPRISQKLPTKGSIALTNELRVRKYDFSTVSNGAPRQNFRNRLTFTAGQPITDKINFEFLYRWQILGENKNDYTPLAHAHWFQMGIGFTL